MRRFRLLDVAVAACSRRVAGVLASAAALAPIAFLLLPAASASSTASLRFTGFGAIAVDAAHARVYVSGGRLDSRVAVLDASGRVEKMLSKLPGASGLAFDPSYGTLYVSLSSGEIAKIDTATEKVSGRFSVAPYVPSGQMAYAGGRLWFGQSCRETFAPIVHVNPDGSGLGVSGPPRYCPTFAATAARPELLAVSELGLSPVDANLYRVDSGDLVLQASTSGRPFSNMQNLAFNRSGTVLYAASGAPYEIQSFRLPDMTPSVRYVVGAYPGAVAAASDGHLAAARSGVANTIGVYTAANPKPVRKIPLPAGREIVPGGLVFLNPTNIVAVTVPTPGSGAGTVSVDVFNTKDTPASDRAYARSLLLRKSDLPAGRWRVKSAQKTNGPAPACATRPSAATLTTTAEATVEYAQQQATRFISSGATIFLTSTEAARAYATESSTRFGRCLATAIASNLNTDTVSAKLTKVVPVSITGLRAPARGFRTVITLRSGSRVIPIEQTTLVLHHGRAVAWLVLTHAGPEWRKSVMKSLAAKTATRIARR